MSELHKLLTEDISQDHTLTSIYEIEHILLILDQIEHKSEHYANLKKFRVQSIDAKISELSAKKNSLRQVILNTMNKMAPDEKTINFPSIGKVSRRKSKESWSVSDEKQLLEFLDGKGMKKDLIKTTESVDKRKMNKALDELRKEGENIPGVEKLKGKESLSVTFEKVKTMEAPSENITIDEVDLEALDALTL